jgi:hypothetical protein
MEDETMSENVLMTQAAPAQHAVVWNGGYMQPVQHYAARQHLDEVRELTADWEPYRDLNPVFDLVARAKTLGFKLVKA